MKKNRKDKKEVINDPDVKQFLEAHRAELTNAMIDEDLNVLQEYKDQQNIMTVINLLIVQIS